MSEEIELYKSRVIQSVYNKMQSLRDSSLANITAILETPITAGSDHLELELANLLEANMNLTQLENLFGTVQSSECCDEKKECDKEKS